MSDIAALVSGYVERYNAGDIEGMLQRCWPDVVYETVANPGGVLRLEGAEAVRGILQGTFEAFSERRLVVMSLLVDGARAAAETVFSGVAAADLGPDVRTGDLLSIRGCAVYEEREGRLCRICDYS
jgi:ketosteroid isomerase-like protein